MSFVKTDFLSWGSWVVPGGVIAFYDTRWSEGVHRFVREFIFPSFQFKNIGFVGDIVYGQKVSRNSVFGWLRNQIVLALWLSYRFYAAHPWKILKWSVFFLKKIGAVKASAKAL